MGDQYGGVWFTQGRQAPRDVEFHINALRSLLAERYPGKWSVRYGPLDEFGDRLGDYTVNLLNKGVPL